MDSEASTDHDKHGDNVARLTRIELKLDEIGKLLTRHDQLLFGNGHAGMILDVDRLKAANSTQRKAFWAISSIVGAVIVAAVLRVLGIH